MLLYLFYILIEKGVMCIPLKASYAAARMLGLLRWLQWGRGRRAVRRNLAVIVPDASPRAVRRTVMRTFINFGLNIMEFFGFERFDRRFFEERCEIFGEDHLKESLKRGRGVIFLSAHFSNWELGVAAYAARGYPITVVALPHRSERIERLFVGQRAKRGLRVLSTSRAARGALKALRNNGILGMLGERLAGDEGVPVEFCDRRVLFPRGPAWLAVKTGAAVLPTLGIRKGDNTFTILSDQPILPPSEGDEEGKILTVTQRFASFFERYLKRYPELWATFFDFFAEQAADGPGQLIGKQRSDAVGKQP